MIESQRNPRLEILQHPETRARVESHVNRLRPWRAMDKEQNVVMPGKAATVYYHGVKKAINSISGKAQGADER